jgi:hypothetical protein
VFFYYFLLDMMEFDNRGFFLDANHCKSDVR